MGYTTLQNTPITIDLTQQGNSRGWSISGTDAIHEACNNGYIDLISYPITAGLSYEYSYQIKSIDSGFIRPELGGVIGTSRTSIGYYTETATAVNNGKLRFYSTANNRISLVNIRVTTEVFDLKSKNTIVWSEKNNKWSDYRNYSPDCGYSLFTDMFTYKNGSLYAHKKNNTPNNYYGVQYKSIINVVANSGKTIPQTFESISYEASGLMVTTTDGIKTSLGQLSELTEQDFLKDVLNDGVTTVNIYDVEGMYSSGFWKEKPDLINGRELKGTYVTIELIQSGTGFLRLKNFYVHSEPSKIGAR